MVDQLLPEAKAVKLSESIAAAKGREPEKERLSESHSDESYDPTKWYDASALAPIVMFILFVILPIAWGECHP